MNDPFRYVGRIGKLNGGLAPGTYIKVSSYDPETTEYTGQTLKGTICVHHAKPSEIEFQTIPEFMDAFPNPPRFVIQDSFEMKNIPSGSVVDFTECTSDPVVDGGKLFIRGSYRFVGKRSQSEDGSETLTRLPYCVYVGAQNESDIIEFENILFEDFAADYNVICLRGNILFRGCNFNGASTGFKIGAGNTPVKVLLEGGNIFYAKGYGVSVDACAAFSAVGVRFKGSGVGIWTKGGSTCTVSECTFIDNVFGLVLTGQDSTAELNRCTFTAQQLCGVLVDGGTLSMTGCKLTGALGIVVVDQIGWVRATATLVNCTLNRCECGLRISGIGTVICSNLGISECTLGIYVTNNSTGDVLFYNLRYENNAIDMVNFAQEDSRLSINDAKHPSSNLQERIQEVHDIVLARPEQTKVLSNTLNTEWSMRAKRLILRLQLHVPLLDGWQYSKVRYCNQCNGLETADKSRWFKKCGRCRKVSYCSKECQATNWEQHKAECRMPNNWYRQIGRMDHASCMRCQKIVSRAPGFDDAVLIKSIAFCQECTENHKDEVMLCVSGFRSNPFVSTIDT